VSGLVIADYKALAPADRRKLGKVFSPVAQTLIVIIKNWANECQVPPAQNFVGQLVGNIL
jgi:hypothetical protein